MLRLQSPLPERYTEASQAELAERIAAAKAALADRLFILGHHYQRDEVMRWADARFSASRIRRSSIRLSFTGWHVGWMTKTSRPRTFSRIWQ